MPRYKNVAVCSAHFLVFPSISETVCATSILLKANTLSKSINNKTLYLSQAYNSSFKSYDYRSRQIHLFQFYCYIIGISYYYIWRAHNHYHRRKLYSHWISRATKQSFKY